MSAVRVMSCRHAFLAGLCVDAASYVDTLAAVVKPRIERVSKGRLSARFGSCAHHLRRPMVAWLTTSATLSHAACGLLVLPVDVRPAAVSWRGGHEGLLSAEDSPKATASRSVATEAHLIQAFMPKAWEGGCVRRFREEGP